MYKSTYTGKNGDEEIHIWDTPGKPDFRAIRGMSYIDADVMIINFALSDIDAWPLDVKYWREEYRAYHLSIPIVFAVDKRKGDPLSTEEENAIKLTSKNLRANDYEVWSLSDKLSVGSVFVKGTEAAMSYRSKESTQARKKNCLLL